MRSKKNTIRNSQKGAAALITIVIIAAATLLMAFNAALLGMGELDMGYISQKGEEALYIADGCAEESLRRLKLDDSYAGGTLSFGGGACIIDIVADGDDRTITITGTVDDYNKKIEVDLIIIDSQITINSWEEVDN